jgi:D-3-phosphoglycerate dehydrogenase
VNGPALDILSLGRLAPQTKERLARRHRLTMVDGAVFEAEQIECSGFTVLILRSPFRLTQDALERFSGLRLVIRAGSGLDGIDRSCLARRGVAFVSATGSGGGVAELALALLLSCMRSLPELTSSLRQGRWLKHHATGVEIAGRTLTVVGFGRVGRKVAAWAHALGARVLIVDRSPSKPEKQAALSACCALALELDAALGDSEVLILCCPVPDDGRTLIGARELSSLRTGAFVVNVGRGGLLDEEALIAALDRGELAGAGIDVYSNEPPVASRLVDHPKIVCTPHIGAQTAETMAEIGLTVERELEDWIASGCVKAKASS